MADTKITVDYSDLKQLHAELGKTSSEFQKMVRTVDPVVNSTITFAQKVDTLNSEFKDGRVSGSLYAKVLGDIRKQAHDAGVTMDRFGNIQSVGGKRAKHFNMQIQQAGYQIGDFATQVAMGQNAIMAFSTQGAQLAGFFGGPWGAAIGAGGAILGALVMGLSAATEKARSFDEAASDASDALKEFHDLSLSVASAMEVMEGRFGFLTPELAKLADDFKEIARVEAFRAINDQITALTGNVDGFMGRLENVQELLNSDTWGIGPQDVKDFVQYLQHIEDQSLPVAHRLEDAMSMKELLLENTGGIDNMNSSQREFYTQLVGLIQQMEVFNSLTDGTAQEIERQQKAEEARLSAIELFYENRAKAEEDAAQRARAVAEIIAAREEAIKSETQSLENQIKIAELSSQYGQDSLAVRQELVAQERAAYAVQLRGQGLRRDEVADLLNIFDTLKGIQEQQRQAAEEEKSRLSAIQLFYENRAKQEAEIEERNRKVAEIIAEREKFVADETKTLEDQLVVARLIQQHGEDSVEVRQKIAEQEREAYVAELDRLRIRGEERTLLLELFDAMQKVTEETQAAADALKNISPNLQAAIDQANRFADAMGRARSESAGIGISTTGIQAQIAALQSGATEAQAAATAAAVTLREQLVAEAGGNVGRGTGARIEAQVAERYQQTLAQEQARETLRGLQDTGKSGGGGKDTPYIQQLKAELEYKTRVVGMSEEQARREEILYELNKREEVATEAQINQVVAMEEALRKATEAEEERQKMFDIVETNLESAMMSLVDGSMTVTDAFRNMLRNILLAIYQEQVAKKTANFITSLFMANGGAFNKGVQMFADGGVVSSPTMFGHAGGIGMMGEAGPEAIMPLKRGPDGKLGVKADNQAQGNIVINQSFNFAANGDDSVKKLIAEAAPRIAQMTQNQIIDSRRRGGQMKAAFG